MALTKVTGSVIKDSVSLYGNVSVGGTLTYQDVTKVAALGIGTFRTGIKVLAGQVDIGSNIKLGNAGVVTATSFSGALSGTTGSFSGQVNVGSNIKLGTAGVITATSFVGSGANLTGITQTTINSNADNRIITGSGTANTLNGESTLTYSGDTLLSTNSNFVIKSIDTNASNSENYIQFNAGYITYDSDASNATGYSGHYFQVDGSEKLRINGSGQLIFDADTDTYIHRPQANQLAITVAGGSFPIVRFGTGGSGSTVGFSTDSNLVTNSERISVRGYSSFKSDSNVYAAIYTHNEGNTSGTYNAHLLWNAGGANRGGIGYMPNNGEVIFNNQNPINFATGATNLGGTTRLRIDNNGYVTTPSQPSFRATKSGSSFNTGGGIVVFDQNQHNTGSNYNTSNGRFTAPIAGTYIFHYYSIYTGNTGNDLWDFRKNGSTFAGSRMHMTNTTVGGSWDNVTNTQIHTLSANDYVEIYASDQGLHGGDWCHFCGHLLG